MKLTPFDKAIAPALTALIGALVTIVISGKINTTTLTVAITGVALAALTYFVPNATTAPAATYVHMTNPPPLTAEELARISESGGTL